MSERVVKFAGELLAALAQRDGLAKVMVSVNKEEQIVTAFASREHCGRTATYTIDFGDVFTVIDRSQLIRCVINWLEVQLAGKSIEERRAALAQVDERLADLQVS